MGGLWPEFSIWSHTSVDQCPSSECNLLKGENVCVKVGYNIKNTYIERYKCGNTTILDSECNYQSCPVFQDVCLKVFAKNNSISDCLYESTLRRRKYSPCDPILKYYTYSSNCTVSPAEESCICSGLGVRASVTLLLGVLLCVVTWGMSEQKWPFYAHIWSFDYLSKLHAAPCRQQEKIVIVKWRLIVILLLGSMAVFIVL